MNYKKISSLASFLKSSGLNSEANSVSLMIKKAMIVHGSGHLIVAYKANIWLFKEDDIDEDTLRNMFDALGIKYKLYKDYRTNTFQKLKDKYYDFYKIKDELETRDDVLTGRIDASADYLTIDSAITFGFDPKSSILAKKIVKDLNLKGANIIDDEGDDRRYSKSEMTGVIPDIMYHGTSTKYLHQILKHGIVPRSSQKIKSNTNFKDVEHHDIIFLTSRFDKADFHAKNAAAKNGGDPMVLKIRVSDKSKIVPDYDVDRRTEMTDVYENVPVATRSLTRYDPPKMEEGAMSFSRETGFYGYRGRIPSSFISTYDIIPNYGEDSTGSYYPADAAEARIYCQTKDDLGFGSFEYEPEQDEEEYDE